MKNTAVKYGLIIGCVSVGILMMKYFIDPKQIFSFLSIWSLLGVVFTLVLLFLAAKTARDQNGGVISFGEAFKTSFIAYLISAVLSALTLQILMYVIDTGLQEIAMDAQLGITESTMRWMGASEADILEAIEEAEENMETIDINPIGQFFIGILNAVLFFGLPISAIIGLIVKRKPKQA